MVMIHVPKLLGAIAVASTISLLVFQISFAVEHIKASLPVGALTAVASVFSALSLASVLLVLNQFMRNNSLNWELERSQPRWKTILRLAISVCILSSFLTITTLIWLRLTLSDLPHSTIGVSTYTILVTAFALWGCSCLAQGLFYLSITRGSWPAAPRLHSFQNDEERRSPPPEMKMTSLSDFAPSPARTDGKASLESSPQGSVSTRKRSGSDTMNSIRSSISNVVRPISSKTRLVPQKQAYRRTSVDSGTGEREISEEGFDSWDTSAVDQQSWQGVMVATTHTSPTQGRVLETIPASPTVSRSPSPGYPLDLPTPLAHRRRSRSHSPAVSTRRSPTYERAASPSDHEAHIHPLFRSDSPTPPPSATPGTIVTAAPNAGQVISDRRSVKRMRSGSLPASPSPLIHSNSMDDIGRFNRVEEDEDTIIPPERQMTPPIPDWVMGAGPRSSMTGYSKRKGPAGLGAVGEVKEL